MVAGGLVVCAGVKGLFKSVLKVFLKVFESDEHNNIFASGKNAKFYKVFGV